MIKAIPIRDHTAADQLATLEPVSRVLLVCLPYQHLKLSSLSLALLATLLRKNGVECHEAYMHLEFARLVGRRAYTIISDSGTKNTILGELLFAEQYRGSNEPAINLRLGPLFGDRRARADLLDRFARSCLKRIEQLRCGVVGLTTSFNQLMPSLWLARLIKEQLPGIRIVLGGASCSSPMGERIAEYYRDVDLVVSGFGEQPMVDLALGRIAAERRFVHNSVAVNLNELPIPDYEPFMREWRKFDDQSDGSPWLAFESSRGCWWGQKHHCKFCGLNQHEMAFNAKSSARVVDEIRTLWDRHSLPLFATDTILARNHLKDAFPQLSQYLHKPELFYEVKANMARREVATMRAANVTTIQPGIESLNSAHLKLLGKGVKAIQNLALLKWCRELRIAPTWNLLYGIPGEQDADYFAQIDLIDRIPHFAPPEGAHIIQIDRFSPYFTLFREFGWQGIEPLDEYRLMHPEMSDEALGDTAYHFRGVGAAFSVQGYEGALRAAVDRWKNRHSAGDGLYLDPANGLVSVCGDEVSVLGGDDRIDAVVACTHEVTSVQRVEAATQADNVLIAALQDSGLLWQEGDQLINLVVRLPT